MQRALGCDYITDTVRIWDPFVTWMEIRALFFLKRVLKVVKLYRMYDRSVLEVPGADHPAWTVGKAGHDIRREAS